MKCDREGRPARGLDPKLGLDPTRCTDPDGREIVLTEDRWNHIIWGHQEMGPYRYATIAAITTPDHRDDNLKRNRRERYYRQGYGPNRWLVAVVSYDREPAWVVTAYGMQDDPEGWRSFR